MRFDPEKGDPKENLLHIWEEYKELSRRYNFRIEELTDARFEIQKLRAALVAMEKRSQPPCGFCYYRCAMPRRA